MVEEARLEQQDAGLTAVTDGWFVVNVRDAPWVTSEGLSDACIFEGDEAPFPQVGFTLAVLRPEGAKRPLPPRGQPGELPRALRRSACCWSRARRHLSVGLRALPARHRPHHRRRRRRALPRLHDGRARGLAREGHRLPARRWPSATAQAWTRRRRFLPRPMRRGRSGSSAGRRTGTASPGPDGQVAPDSLTGVSILESALDTVEGRAGRERGRPRSTQRPATSSVSTSWRRRAVRTTTTGRGHHGDVRRRECPRRRCVRGGRVLGRRNYCERTVRHERLGGDRPRRLLETPWRLVVTVVCATGGR